MHHIALADKIFLALETQLAGLFGSCLPLTCEKIVVRDDLCPDEPAFEISVYDPSSLRRGRAPHHCPGPHLFHARREIRLQP